MENLCSKSVPAQSFLEQRIPVLAFQQACLVMNVDLFPKEGLLIKADFRHSDELPSAGGSRRHYLRSWAFCSSCWAHCFLSPAMMSHCQDLPMLRGSSHHHPDVRVQRYTVRGSVPRCYNLISNTKQLITQSKMVTIRCHYHSAQSALQCCLGSKFCATSVGEAVISAVIEKAGPASVSGECSKGSPCGLGSFSCTICQKSASSTWCPTLNQERHYHPSQLCSITSTGLGLWTLVLFCKHL